jgi:flagellar protein FliS
MATVAADGAAGGKQSKFDTKGEFRMIPAQAREAYRRSETQSKNMPPEKLIHLLYERALQHLHCAGEGIDERNPRKRGENLGKAIAFVTELNASLDMEKGGEAAVFLHGLYEAILVELSKVSVTNDMEVIKRTCRYLQTLKDIWEQTVMKKTAVVTPEARTVQQGAEAQRQAIAQKFPLPAAMEREVQGLSVSV